MKINEKLKLLRNFMKDENIDTYLISKFDPHQSEYSPEFWNEVKFMSGFSGSAGLVVVTQEEALLHTDGRYYIQAEKELKDTEFKLFKLPKPGERDLNTYIRDITPKGGIIGFDDKKFSITQVEEIESKIKFKEITFKTDKNLVSNIWQDKPELSKVKVYEHLIKYCGKSRTEKIKEVQEELSKHEGDIYVISSNDDIAWLFNLRGQDVAGAPFFASFAVIEKDRVCIFISNKISSDVAGILEKDNIILKDYSEIESYLKDILKAYNTKAIVLLDPDKTSYFLVNVLKDTYLNYIYPNITSSLKAIKNEVELKNLENLNIRDGVILLRFIIWLKDSVKSINLTEWDISEKLIELRKKDENFVDPSFTTIAAYMESTKLLTQWFS